MNDKIQEKILKTPNGLLILVINLLIMILSTVGFIFSIINENVILIIAAAIIAFLICPIVFGGLKVVKPNEALVLTLFGKYYGTLVGAGFYFVNPFCVSVNPTKKSAFEVANDIADKAIGKSPKKSDNTGGKSVSLKVLTHNNEKQKVNDKLGNPIEIGVVVIWKVINAAQAVFAVDNYIEFLSIQADSSLRNIVRLYPYDIADGNDLEGEMSLRGSSKDVANNLKDELQEKVRDAGIEIVETRITHLAYAPEIAAAMLQRQQASAVIDARKLIVEGAVGMVDMALKQLSDNDIVDLDEERKAAMVSNLLVVLCSNKESQPVLNSGSIY